MPRAVPACWTVSLRAEPTPALSAGMVPIRAPTAAGMAAPAPRPRRPRAIAGTVRPEPASTVVSRAKQATMISMPARITTRLPIFAATFTPAVFPTIAVTASGRKARPALIAE